MGGYRRYVRITRVNLSNIILISDGRAQERSVSARVFDAGGVQREDELPYTLAMRKLVSKINSKGQTTTPKAVRVKLGLTPGDLVR